MLADAEDVARFQREMRIASRMQHPNIMTMFTTGSDNGVPLMVMEYLSATGTLIGTLPYMAPEQWLGGPTWPTPPPSEIPSTTTTARSPQWRLALMGAFWPAATATPGSTYGTSADTPTIPNKKAGSNRPASTASI